MQSNAKVASEADVTFPISFVLELKVVRAVPCPKELLEERGADALTAVQEMAVCVDEACSDRLLLRILGANGTPGGKQRTYHFSCNNRLVKSSHNAIGNILEIVIRVIIFEIVTSGSTISTAPFVISAREPRFSIEQSLPRIEILNVQME